MLSGKVTNTLSSSYDKEGLRTGLSGKLWKLNDKGLLKGTRPWKCRWASSDGVNLDVWATDEREGPPKYSLPLYDCRVEELHHYPNRKHVFVVHTRGKDLKLTLSAENVMDLEEWVSFLIRFTEGGHEEHEDEDEDAKDDGQFEQEQYVESTEELQIRFIKNFFSKHNVSSSQTNPIISEKHLQELVVEISGVSTAAQTDLIMKYFFRRSGMVAQFISLEDFMEFLDVFQSRSAMTLSCTSLPGIITGREDQEGKASLGNHYSENALTLGIVDPVLRGVDITPSMVMLMRAVIPNVKSISIVNGPPSDSPIYMNGHANWNDKYQRLLVEALKAYPLRGSSEGGEDEGDNNQGNEAPREDEEDREPTKSEILDNVSACLQLAAFQGTFLHTAVEGAQIIVDEYTLPDKYKTTHVLHHHHHVDKEQSEKKEPTEFQNVELQSSSGSSMHDTLSFSDLDDGPKKPIAYSLSDYYKRQISNDSPSPAASEKGKDFENDMSVSTSTESSVNESEDMNDNNDASSPRKTKDDQVHVDADHIYKGLIFSIVGCKPDPSVDRLPTEQRLKQLAATDVLLHKSASNEHRGQLAFQYVLGKSPQKSMLFSTMSTLVDYGGFRVHVMCPLSLEEESAILGGHMGESNENVEGILSNLLRRMNIDSLSEPVAPSSTAGLFANSEYQQPGHVFPEGLEVHVDEKGDDYVVNLAHLLPMEMPRPHTSDIQTRRVRPEFLAAYSSKFKTDCMSTVQVDEADSLFEGKGEEKSGGMAQDIIAAADGRAAVAKAAPLLRSTQHFFTAALPELVRALDSLSTMPFDSYSLSQCFHSFGVGMHHMGTVYSMSKSRTTRCLLLGEAVARSCKVIVNNVLRRILRTEKATALVAEMRDRSEREDYIEHVNDVQKRKEESLLDFFNLVFGSSQESSTMWRSTLPDAVYQKFSLVVPSSLQALNKAQFIHLPHLFLAMQYHIGILFLDHCSYPFEQPPVKPFSRKDVIHFFQPAAKSMSHSNNQVLSAGYVGFLDTLAESFLGADLPNEAVRLFRLRMSLQLSSGRNFTSHKSSKSIASTSYKLALALYNIGDYQGAVKTIEADMSQRPRYTALNGRFLTLLMSSHFMSGAMDKAMEAYDAGSVVYSFSLGPHHPMQAIHMGVLADLYRKSGNYKLCSLMLNLACEVSQQTNGDSHVLTASYMYKTAANSYALAYSLSRELRGFHLENALDSFQEALSVYRSIETSGADVKAELLSCMYAVAVINKDLRRMDEALDCLEEAEEFIKSNYLSGGNMDSRDLAIIPLVAISSLSLMVDFLMRRNECAKALSTLKIIWTAALSRPSHFFDIHEIISKLSCKMLSLLLSSQSYSTRNLINVICEEVESEDEPGYGVDALDAWSNARGQVLTGLLQTDPETYFAAVVDGLLKGEIEANNAKEPTKGRRRSTIAVSASSFALQMAVIVRLAKNV